MLSPEVWNFQAPLSHFNIRKGKHGVETPFKTTCNSFYNHIVAFVLPDAVKYPEELLQLLVEDTEFYKVKDIGVEKLVERNFIEQFVRRGKLTLLSTGVFIDCDNCICITPTGQLILSLIKESYQSLGIEGKLSYFSHKTKNRYIIKVDLLADSFRPGKKKYERVKSGLRKLEKFTVLVNWHPPSEDVCPSSIAHYFDNNGYKVEVQKPDLKKGTEYSVKMPMLDVVCANDEDIFDFNEWLGMLLLEGCTDENYEYLSAYRVPEPNCEVGQVKTLEIRGLFTIQQIECFYTAFRKLIDTENDKMWIAMYVQGFSDSLVSWDLQEHDFYTNGDYSTVLIMSSLGYVVCKQKNSNKYYKYK